MAQATVNLEQDELRTKISEVARKHKASWIELGQYLHTIQKNKIFRYWGFLEFDNYCMKELGIQPQTALKMMRSYLYLEKEEPRVIQKYHSNEDEPRNIPNYESVNILRLAAKNPRMTTEGLATIKEHVFDSAKEPREVRAHVKKLLSDRGEIQESGDVRKNRRNSAIRRLIRVLTNTKKEFENEKLLPAFLLKEIESLEQKLEDQIEA